MLRGEDRGAWRQCLQYWYPGLRIALNVACWVLPRKGRLGHDICERTRVLCFLEMNPQSFFDLSQLQQQQAASGRRYLEFIRVPSMSAGVYVLPAGGNDPQSPHKEDEMYYVVRGRARMTVAGEEQAIEPGSVIFVGANVDHRFHDIQEELVVLVFFAPVES